MSARDEIENTLYRLAWLFDMDAIEQIDTCFTSDAEVEYPPGTGAGLIAGRAGIVKQYRRLRDSFYERGLMQWHVISNVFISQQADATASVKTFYTSIQTAVDGTPTVGSIGYYDDEFVREDDAWRIARRRVVSAEQAGAELPRPLAG